MTGHDHWLEAEVILTEKACDYGCPHAGCEHEMAYLARAQVHATLALGAFLAPGLELGKEVNHMSKGNSDPKPSKPDGSGIEKIIGAGSNPKNN